MSNPFWLYVVLVNVPVPDLALLRERDREIPAIRTRTIGVARLRGREPKGDFGITRVSVHLYQAAMTLVWNERMVGRASRTRTEHAPLGRHIVISLGDHCVLAQSFLTEVDARAWAKERHETPVPHGR